MNYDNEIKNLYIKHRREIIAYIYSITESVEVSEDIFHDCIIKIIKYCKRNSVQNLKALFYKTARNLSLNHIKKNKNIFYLTNEEASSLTSIDNFEEKIFTDELNKYIYTFVEKFDYIDKAIFILKKEYGMNSDRIANYIGRSKRTVRRKLKYILEHLIIKVNKLDTTYLL